ncbi:MAG: class I SAM-dependent methyltransferase [Pseudonocardia sp.]
MISDNAGAALERLLRAATGQHGGGPLPWVAAPLQEADRVLDLDCGSGPLADELRPGHWAGVARAGAGGERRPQVRGAPTALPIRTNAVDAVCLLLTLPHLADLDDVFAEIRRVLRPGGTLVTVVPSVSMRSVRDWQLARLLRPVRRGAWRNRSGLDGAGWLLAAADFAVLGDDRARFALPIPDAETAARAVTDLTVAGIWPPGLPATVRAHLAQELGRRAGSGQVLPIPLRRLTARR